MPNLSALWAGVLTSAQSAAQNVEQATEAAVQQQTDAFRQDLAQTVLTAGTEASAGAAAAIAPDHPVQLYAKQHATALYIAGAALVLVVVLLLTRRRR